MNDPNGRARLHELGVRSVPVLARGKDYVFGQRIEDVARFVGVTYDAKSLTPDELVRRWSAILHAGQRIMRQFPQSALEERVHEKRDQSIRHMGYHALRLGDAFLATAVDGVEDWLAVSMEKPGTALATGADVAAYGDGVIERLEQWWTMQSDRQCSSDVKTYSGVQSLREFLERQTWHSAQHIRQLAWRLEQMGIAPDGPLTAKELAGLPIPEAIWG
jgi:predicted DNA-binding WGR domain protein